MFAVGGGDSLEVHLDPFAVVGHEAVNFDLDIGGLGVNGGGQAFFGDEWEEFFHQVQVSRGQGWRVGVAAVTPVFFILPGVAFDGQAEPAKPAESAAEPESPAPPPPQ